MSSTSARGTDSRRRNALLTIALSGLVALDMAMYSVAAPVLPVLKNDVGLTDSAAGNLIATFPLGLMLFAVPAGWLVDRWGAKNVLVLGTLVLAATSVGFGLSPSVEGLFLTRFVQGMSSAASWAGALTWLMARADHRRQGAAIGSAMAAAGAGAVLGPSLGVLAVLLGRSVVFGVVGGVAVAFVLALSLSTAPPRTATAGLWSTVTGVIRGLGATLMGTVLFCAASLGALTVFIPLLLDHQGAAAGLIGSVFLGVALIEMTCAPLIGRLVDRIGLRAPLIGLLLLTTSVGLLSRSGSVPSSAVLVLICLPAVGLLYTPSLIGLANLVDQRGLSLAGLVGVSNLVFAMGEGLGAVLAGRFEARGATSSGLVGLAIAAALVSLMACRLLPRDPLRSSGTQASSSDRS